MDGHYAGEPEVYRDKAEVAEWRAREPIARFRHDLLERGTATEADLDGIDAEVKTDLEEGIAFARASAEPDPATALDYIYA
jgi:TPP-dependent pyruvate/acetoin dehydrogenase alpha subunit